MHILSQLLLILIATCAMAAAASAGPTEMRAGKWQIMTQAGITGEKPVTAQVTECMTKEKLTAQAMGPAAGIAKAAEGDYEEDRESGGCTYHVIQRGSTLVMSSECKGVKAETRALFGADTFLMRSTTGGGKPTSSTTKGKRLGDC